MNPLSLRLPVAKNRSLPRLFVRGESRGKTQDQQQETDHEHEQAQDG